MLSRIKEAKRIITYREPDFGPDAVIEEQKLVEAPKAGRTIAYFFEFLFVFVVLVRASTYIGIHLEKMIPKTHSVSTTTMTAAVGIILTLLLDSVRTDILGRIRKHLSLVDLLAPYFGHRLDNTIRVFRG
jgi:hypothetical protein